MTQPRIHPKLLFLLLALLNFIFWWAWLAPYKMFPADDLTLIEYGINIHIPVFELVQAAVKHTWLLFSNDKNSALLILTLLSNSISLYLASALVFKLTRSRWAAGAAGLVLLTQGWSATYYLLASYAPLAAMLSLLSLYLLHSAWRMRTYGPNRATLYKLLAAGGATGLFAFSSSGAPVMAFLLCVSAAVLFWDGSVRHWRVYAGFFAAPLAFVGLLFSNRIVRAYIHLHENADSYHYADALKVFNYVPRPPFFTFFRIGMISSPVLILLFGAALLGVAVMALRRLRGRGPEFIVLLWLGLLLAAHGLIIDLLPFTKLGRTHYPMVPLLVVFTVTAIALAIDARRSKAWRWPARLAGAVLLAALLISQIRYDREMAATRLGPQSFFASLPPESRIYGHPDDPTGYFLVMWLQFKGFGARSMEEIKPAPAGAATVFIVGPHGPRSGRIGLRHSVLPDYTFDPAKIFRPQGAEEITFPYYGYFPGFLMEEEISMALYFEGQAADFHAPDKQLTIWKW